MIDPDRNSWQTTICVDVTLLQVTYEMGLGAWPEHDDTFAITGGDQFAIRRKSHAHDKASVPDVSSVELPVR